LKSHARPKLRDQSKNTRIQIIEEYDPIFYPYLTQPSKKATDNCIKVWSFGVEAYGSLTPCMRNQHQNTRSDH